MRVQAYARPLWKMTLHQNGLAAAQFDGTALVKPFVDEKLRGCLRNFRARPSDDLMDQPFSRRPPVAMEENRRRIVAWVGVHVMPHEAGVRTWLRRARVAPDDIDDLIQEAYARMAALDSVDHIARPDGYFFQTVRNLLTEQMRRARIVRIEAMAEIESLPVHADEPSPEAITADRRELARVRRLIEGLPDRCRRIFELRKIEGVPQREIARMLGVTEATVENDGVKGLRLIMRALGEEAARLDDQSRDEDARPRNRRRD